jgi:hypothetical protein
MAVRFYLPASDAHLSLVRSPLFGKFFQAV